MGSLAVARDLEMFKAFPQIGLFGYVKRILGFIKKVPHVLGNHNHERKAVIFLVVASMLVQSFIILIMPLSLSEDSLGYILQAKDLFAELAFQRTIGYPFLIAFGGLHYLDSMILLVYLQSLMAISIPILVYFTIRPFSKNIAFLAALVNLVILYPYVLAAQVLTETPFMFATALLGFFLSRYFHTVKLQFLIAAIGATFIIALLRVSGTPQFICLLAALGVLFIYNWRHLKVRHMLLRHGAIAVAIFVAWQVGYGAMTDRTSKNLLPYFTFNWLYMAPADQLYYGIIHPKNGKKSEKLFTVLGELVEEDPNLFRTFAVSAKDNVKAIVESKEVYNSEDSATLVDDLINNNFSESRGFEIPFNLKYKLGTTKASELLYGAMSEAVMANPDIIVKRIVKASKDTAVSLSYPLSAPFRTLSSWSQIPKTGQGDFFGLGPSIVSEWLYSMSFLVGSDEEAKKLNAEKGRFPATFKEAWIALEKYRNFTAFGTYLTVKTARIIPFIWVLMFVGFGLFIWSTNPAAAFGLALAGFFPAAISVVLSEVDTRHFSMPFPIQLMAAAAAVSGFINLLSKLFGRFRESQ